MEFILYHFTYKKSVQITSLYQEFNSSFQIAEKTKSLLSSSLGPYLANPYYQEKFSKIQSDQVERSKIIVDKINTTQFALIEVEKKFAQDFTIRILNNFEVLLTLFNNFIFEEDFITLGDEEYLRERKDYNFLCKVKSNESKGKVNLDSKRSFKKPIGS